jgi:Domain of unknown function (DUF4190)
MAISVTCTCGARLELDEKFAGQAISCPDCQRPLNTRTPVVEAPPDRPVSGLALTSLILALAGIFTLIGSVAAVVLGYLAAQQIARSPDRYSGRKVARAGMIAGVAGILLALGGLLVGDVLRIDGLLREWRYAGEIDYRPTDGNFFKASLGKDDYVGLEPPSRAWGKLKPRRESDKDMLTLFNVREDAYLMCLPFEAADLDDARRKALERLRQSDLFKRLTKPSDTARQTGPDPEPKPVPEGKEGDQRVEVRLGGYDRTFLLRVVKQGPDLYLLAGGARTSRFTGLLDEFLRAFESFKQIQVEN